MTDITEELTSSSYEANNKTIFIKHKPCIIGKYEIDVVLDENNKFLYIDSIKISEKFYKPFSTGLSAEEIINEYLKEEGL